MQEQADAHLARLTALTAEDGPLTAAGATASVRNPDWFTATVRGPVPKAGRRRLHRRILADADQANPDVATDRQAIVLAGPPGAGKSTALRALLAADGTPPEQWRVINSDDFKDDLLDAALDDGSYYQWLLPPEVAELEAAGEAFGPRELASLVHQESGMLAQQSIAQSIERGDNLVIDGTLSQETTAHQLVESLAEAGYSVRIAAVEAPRDVVETRIAARWRAGYLASETGTAHNERDARLGGRWVAYTFARSLYPPGTAQDSVCPAVARSVAERHQAVIQLDVYRVAAADSSPQLVEHRIRPARGQPLLAHDATHLVETAHLTRLLTTQHHPASPEAHSNRGPTAQRHQRATGEKNTGRDR